MAEWSLGRHTRRSTLAAFRSVGLPGGRTVGWLLSLTVLAAVAYYNNAIGWVVYHGIASLTTPLGLPLDPARILPPADGFSVSSFALQLSFTALVLLVQAMVLLRGLRAGIERASRVLTPILFGSLLLLIARSVTLFMVTYGSYLSSESDVRVDAAWTVAGDTAAGLLAGLALFPAVFALGLEPGSGPGLLFATVPELFRRLPGGVLFGPLFFGSLAGAALLSGIAAYEVLVAGVGDALGWTRPRAVRAVGIAALALAVPPMINLRIFVPWDLTFGSGAQTFGALLAVVAAGWAMRRGDLLRELAGDRPGLLDRLLVGWLRFVIPATVLTASVWWLLTDVLHTFASV